MLSLFLISFAEHFAYEIIHVPYSCVFFHLRCYIVFYYMDIPLFVNNWLLHVWRAIMN